MGPLGRVDSVWEQKKPEARKLLAEGAARRHCGRQSWKGAVLGGICSL